MKSKNLILIFVVISAILGGIFLGTLRSKSEGLAGVFKRGTEIGDKNEVQKIGEDNSKESPFKQEKDTTQDSIFAKKDTINILLLGIDRRSKAQTGFNTDTMILLSANTKDNVVLLTSVPRDIWINGNKINALYTVFGEETLLDAFEKITGMPIDGYIRADFEDFRWIVDSFGGVPVDVARGFTDSHFPNNTDTGLKPVTFTAGRETMDGWRALDFARSRKGTNGEGSDLMRAKRQHRILKGMVEGISQPQSRFWPMDIPKFYEAVTQRMYTTLTIGDVYYLWDFYKDREDYTVKSFVVDGTYVYHPGMYPQSEYHAWVFIPRDPSWSDLHEDIEQMLYPPVFPEETPESTPSYDTL